MPYNGPVANPDVFRAIENRLASFSPPINLREYLVDQPTSQADLIVHPLTLQGIDFTIVNPDKFVAAIEAAKNGADKAFLEGSTKPNDWKQHWAMTASLLATKGIGFREIWRFYLNDRQTQVLNSRPSIRNANDPQFDEGFAANFGDSNPLNLTALHIAVAYGKWTACNIHIDETGITMAGLGNNVSVTPNVVGHFFNELGFKTILGEHLPDWFIDRVNLHVLSPDMDYRRLGVSVDVLKGDSYKVTLSASCGLTNCSDIDVSKIIRLDTNALKSLNPTINFSGRFNLGGG